MKVSAGIPNLQDGLPDAREQHATRGGFHSHDGWFFQRIPDGKVRIRQHAQQGASNQVLAEVVMSAHEWASIVCSVSHDGEDGERWKRALQFHGELN